MSTEVSDGRQRPCIEIWACTVRGVDQNSIKLQTYNAVHRGLDEMCSKDDHDHARDHARTHDGDLGQIEPTSVREMCCGRQRELLLVAGNACFEKERRGNKKHSNFVTSREAAIAVEDCSLHRNHPGRLYWGVQSVSHSSTTAELW